MQQLNLESIATKTYPNSFEQLEQCLANGRDIYLFGGIRNSCTLASATRNFLDSRGIEIKGHLAESAFIPSATYKGKPFYALEEWSGDKNVNIIIGTTDVKAKAKMLKELGFKNLYFLNPFQDLLYRESCSKDFKEFFLTHQDRFQATYDCLSDDLSRTIMRGYLQARIYNNYDILAQTYDKNNYFTSPLSFGQNEVFVDCGAYDGDTCLEFVKNVPNYVHIYAFEPDTKILPKLQENTKNLRCTIVPKGAYEREDVLHFSIGSNGDSTITTQADEHTISIPTQSIDNVVPKNLKGGGNIYIKMDIEGGELSALKGAEETIKRYKPKLGICVYHKREDLITIPQYILSLNKDYKLYLRNRTPVAEDTILLAF